MDFLEYKNKRVIVSGCFSGMGEATARMLVEQGAESFQLWRGIRPDTKPVLEALAQHT